MSILCLTNYQYEHLTRHLLGKSSEQLVFLFASMTNEECSLRLQCERMLVIPKSGFDYQSSYHIALTDEMRQKVIIQASNDSACLVEAHSHIDDLRSVKFSPSDLAGFREFVPHVRWRLNGRPYVALVFNSRGFDALVWNGRNNQASLLSSIRIANRDIKPTGLTYHEIRISQGNKGGWD